MYRVYSEVISESLLKWSKAFLLTQRNTFWPGTCTIIVKGAETTAKYKTLSQILVNHTMVWLPTHFCLTGVQQNRCVQRHTSLYFRGGQPVRH